MKILNLNETSLVAGGNWFSETYDAVYYATYDAVSVVKDALTAPASSSGATARRYESRTGRKYPNGGG